MNEGRGCHPPVPRRALLALERIAATDPGFVPTVVTGDDEISVVTCGRIT